MSKALVIVESPAKAKTITKYLGNKYVVKSSVGHIRDLPTSSSASKKNLASAYTSKVEKSKSDERSALVDRMGIDPWHDWRAHYEILPGKEKVINELKKLAKKADHIYLATDLDREGEAIAWHLREVIGGDNKRYSRVIFNEITKNSIRQAFKNPIKLNIDRVNAQQARRFMDRVVGYMISPLLWKKIARGLSAGRVQSVALRLVVERERKIKTFVSEEFWGIVVNVTTPNGDVLPLQITHQNDKPFRLKNREQAMSALALLKLAHYQVLDRTDKLTISKPNAPFTTSMLQQAASTWLGFNVKKTMLIAQRLYEAGYITYMRTDSTNLSQDAVDMVRNYIGKHFGNKYLPTSAVQYINKGNSQEAHEAIRPSNVYIQSAALNDMEIDARKLYQLIWSQFVACQMTAAEYNSMTLTVTAEDFRLRAHGHTLCFDGWMKVMPKTCKNNESNKTLMKVETGDELSLNELIPTQYFTKPPARFSDASLVKELEKLGIGRPSTYAPIISTIQDRGYVRIENRRFYAEKIGEIVTARLEENFRELMDYNFTAQMENQFDKVANHQAEWKKVLDSFFINFVNQLDKAEKNSEEGGMQPNQMVITSISCPTCGRKMGIRTGITGVFLGCSGYILSPKERCKTTINLIPENEIFDVLAEDNAEGNALLNEHRCKKCGSAMDSYLINSNHKLRVCSGSPTCDGYESKKGIFLFTECYSSIIKCEKCGSEMYLKIGRFGKYMACINGHCMNTRKILRNGEVAPPKEDPVPLPELPCKKSDAYFVLRNGEAGVFLAANTFPKSRETRTPLVEELSRFRNRLPEKLRYLADAPQQDTEGNKTVIRFSRKTRQQYLVTEREGKATGWSAFFIEGKWVENTNNF